MSEMYIGWMTIKSGTSPDWQNAKKYLQNITQQTIDQLELPELFSNSDLNTDMVTIIELWQKPNPELLSKVSLWENDIYVSEHEEIIRAISRLQWSGILTQAGFEDEL